jgi:hypothetical protein
VSNAFFSGKLTVFEGQGKDALSLGSESAFPEMHIAPWLQSKSSVYDSKLFPGTFPFSGLSNYQKLK